MTSKSDVKHSPLTSLSLAILLLASACLSGQPPPQATATPPGAHPVDPLFREFYQLLGGMQTLGPAISGLLEDNNLKSQYVEAGLMVFDPQGPADQHFYLAPLGRRLGYSDPPVPDPGEDSHYVDGHIIHKRFVPLYERLGGARFVGKPLTEVHYNPEKNRLEQHFENLGFFAPLGEGDGEARLLFYGAYACDYQCRYQPPVYGLIEGRAALPEPFASTVSRLGSSFVGEHLAGPYQAEDGNPEVIFENLVLFARPDDPRRAYARPIVARIGFEPQPLVRRLDDPLVVFFSVDGEWGHNIPVLFNEYIAQHGSLDIAGFPISEIFLYEEGVFRQCFANLCLDYYLHADPDIRVLPSPLGTIYKAQVYNPLVEQIEAQQGTGESPYRFELSEERAQVTSTQVQTIYVRAFEGQGPLANAELTLTLTLPDGAQHIYLFPLTDPEGQTKLTLPAVAAASGTLVPYEVCLEAEGGARACAQDSYLIWNAP